MSIQARRFTISGTALAVAMTTIGLVPAASAVAFAPAMQVVQAVAAVSVPAPVTKVLPVAVDVQTPYQGQVSCDPRSKPGVAAFAALMTARYKTGTVGTYRPCLGDVSEHYDGRAIDWMLNVNNPQQKAVADSVTAWLSARGGVMARRFGISYIIWNRKVFKEYRSPAGWTIYTGSVPHTDHVHISFSWDGAMKRTSWWTGKATTVVDQGPCRVYAGQFAPLYRAMRTAPCPTKLAVAPASTYRVAVFGQNSPQIAVAQRRLGVTANGQFGWTTFTKLRAWQSTAKLPVTGVLDKPTWARMFKTAAAPVPPVSVPPVSASPATTRYTPYKAVVLQQGSKGSAVVVLQRALKLTADGDFGPITRAAVMTFQTQQHLVLNGVVGRTVWNKLETRDYPLIAFRSITLTVGSTGAAVVAVQRKLRLTANGAFGATTVAAVKVVQGRNNLAMTGVVSGWTWVAIEKS